MHMETFAGMALAAVSFALVVLSRKQLGESFAIVPQAKDLVTHGLYSRLQHPMYLFVDLTVCGVALAARNWHVLLLLIVLLAMQAKNASRERKVLRAKFGERYEAYRQATWF